MSKQLIVDPEYVFHLGNASLAGAEHLTTARHDFLGGCTAAPGVFGDSPAGLRLAGTSHKAARGADIAMAGVAEALQRDTDVLFGSARRYEDMESRNESLLGRGWDLTRPIPGGLLVGGGLSGIVRAETPDGGQDAAGGQDGAAGPAPEPGPDEPIEEPWPSPGRSGEGPLWLGVNEASGDPRIEPWEKNWRGESP